MFYGKHGNQKMAKFFGMESEEEVKPIDVGVVAIYEDDRSGKEIGIWGIYFSDETSADRQFNAIRGRARKLEKKGRPIPYVQQGPLLLFAWNDSNVSDDDFKQILKYLKSKKFSPQK